MLLCVSWITLLSLFSEVTEEGTKKGQSEPSHKIGELCKFRKISRLCFEKMSFILMPGVDARSKRFCQVETCPECLEYSLTLEASSPSSSLNDLLLLFWVGRWSW